MKVYFDDVSILAVIPAKFFDDQGNEVVYTEVHVLHEDADGRREVIKFTPREFDKANEGRDGVIEVDVDVSGKRKPRLLGFQPSA